MQTPSHIVWSAHGATPAAGTVSCASRCYVCALPIARGVPSADAIGDNFTDHQRCKAPGSGYVCEGCAYVMSRTSPVLGRPAKDGKKFGGNFRNYSHLWEQSWIGPAFGEGGAAGQSYINASKGDKSAIRAFLAREHEGPWFAAIGDSGQKHCLIFAPMNGPGRSGHVVFDEQLIRVPATMALVDDMTALLSVGVTKDEVGSGEYYVRSLKERREECQAFERAHGAERGGGWFTLSLWLAQREEAEFQRQDAERKVKTDAERRPKKTAGKRNGGDAPVAKERVSRGVKRPPTDVVLESVPEPDAQLGAPVDHGQRMGDTHDAQAPGAESAQGRFPGFG